VLRAIVPELSGPFEELAAGGDLQRRWLFDGVVETLSRLSAKTPVLLVIEDIHWADSATLSMLKHVLPHIEPLRIVLIATVRDDRLEPGDPLADLLTAIGRAKCAHTLTLGGLSPGDSRSLIESALPARTPLSSRAKTKLSITSGGNPLFIEELAKHVIEFPNDDIETQLPISIEQTMRSRLTAFDEEELRLLNIAAIVGTVFRLEDLAAVSGRSEADVERVLHSAVQRNVLIAPRTGASTYRFRHDLMRHAIASQAAHGDLRAFHKAIAERIEARPDADGAIADLAYHWEAAHDWERARQYAIRAGDAALDLFAYDDAAAEFERPLAHAPAGDPSVAGLHEKLGQCHLKVGLYDEAIAQMQKALSIYEAQKDYPAIARVYDGLATLYSRLTRSSEAIESSRRFLHYAELSAKPELIFGARTQLAEMHWLRGETQEAADQLALVTSLPADADASIASRYNSVHALLAFFRNDFKDWRVYANKAVESTEHENPERRATYLYNRGAVAHEIGDYAMARSDFSTAAAIGQQYGLHFVQVFSAAGLAESLLEQGELVPARDVLRGALGEIQDVLLADVAVAPTAITVALQLGDEELRAAIDIERVLANARATDDPARLGPVLGALAELRVAESDEAAALALLKELLAAVRDSTNNHRALLAVAQFGEHDMLPGARDVLAGSAGTPVNPRTRIYVRTFDAIAHVRRAGAAKAESAVRDAAAAAREFGAAFLADAALAMLQPRTGSRRSDPLATLTKREREVAMLAAAGNSNKEIAMKLTVSERTVEQHMSAVLRKLNARSRTELASMILRLTNAQG
jgi:DNA-binding CsgD family transcriptional regulator/tetratricopeptide (TPR) repeat protein